MLSGLIYWLSPSRRRFMRRFAGPGLQHIRAHLDESGSQRAIQFTRSTPGISVALVGMSKREHVLENVGVSRVPPVAREHYLRLYQ